MAASSGEGVNTTAPAPSPNRTQVRRSVQSTNLDSASIPTTRAQRNTPAARAAPARATPYTNPEQPALRSRNAGSLGRSSPAAMWGAVPGTGCSDTLVAAMSTSTWAGGSWAAARAARAASTPIWAGGAPGSNRCRVWMPVRERIHSSLVSILSARSKLVTRLGGRKEPVPTTFTLSMPSTFRPGAGRSQPGRPRRSAAGHPPWRQRWTDHGPPRPGPPPPARGPHCSGRRPGFGPRP